MPPIARVSAHHRLVHLDHTLHHGSHILHHLGHMCCAMIHASRSWIRRPFMTFNLADLNTEVDLEALLGEDPVPPIHPDRHGSWSAWFRAR